jgi:hypothetical protein
VEKPGNTLYGKKVDISRYWPPFQYIFTDDGGRLFVMTYEKGGSSEKYMYDIFNPDGLFIGKVGLANLVSTIQWDIQYVVAKDDHLYCLREKDSGYKELVVYRMEWN